MSQRLPPAIAGFRVPPLTLADELDRLRRVHGVDAPEGVLFYAGRILESLAAAALTPIGMQPSKSVFANLESLDRYSLIDPAPLHWAHAVRRLGNDARHLLRPIGSGDADVALVFLEGVLRWYFARFPLGPRIDAGEVTGLLATGEVGQLADWIAAIETGELDALSDELTQRAVRAPGAFVEALAELLIDRHRLDAAGALIAAGLGARPESVRLTVLEALRRGRAGDVDGALAALAPVRSAGADDPEIAGIEGGICKRAWRAHGDSEQLAAAQRAYRRGWRRSGRSSVYLGINLATTSLWRGREETARAVAAEVRAILQARARALASVEPVVELCFWDQLTLGESELLLGDTDGARRRYHRVFADHAERVGALASARAQVRDIVAHLGLPADGWP